INMKKKMSRHGQRKEKNTHFPVEIYESQRNENHQINGKNQIEIPGRYLHIFILLLQKLVYIYPNTRKCKQQHGYQRKVKSQIPFRGFAFKIVVFHKL